MRLAAPVQDGRGEKAEVGDSARNVDRTGQADWLAIVPAFGPGEELQVALYEIGHAHDRIVAPLPAQRRPCGHCNFGGFHGEVHVLRVAVRDLCIYLAFRRGMALQPPAT